MGIDGLKLETIEHERDGDVLRVWFNRPERRNAHNEQMVAEVGDLFGALNTDFDIRVVVLGGRGLSFCAGADRKERLEPATNEREQRYRASLGLRATRAMEACEAVTIARVHGHAVGGGCCFATSCDFRIATADTLFYVPEVELGVPLPWGATPRLISEIGAARARQMMMLSERVDGRRAADWGLIHEVVDDESSLDDAVQRWVDRALDMPVLSTHMAKSQMAAYGQASRLGSVAEFDSDASGMASRSEGARERFQNF